MKIERFLRAALSLLAPRRGTGSSSSGRTATPSRPSPSYPRPAARPGGTLGGISAYDVQAWGAPSFSYSPDPDGDADPGEIVWGWVPYEEDASQGKDRPLLIVGTRGRDLVGVQLTSKDHSRDAARETARGRVWVDIGSGAWDSRGRDSEVRVDRVLLVGRDAVRREGATLDRARFDAVATAVRRHHGW
ncbi:type II toxin-antitoxin system PemK/MazF family toxin [Serinibacter arcticus]|uniref:RNA 3'-terminal phosphate cyclase n=1 Tax=Serinibacter arcticus TaxID=1655435 RepID=A0A4Z1E107_9MICO|nr:type II toxin-antitoxin system PemK/MazF family toxin [Serinibacter arcticus]TGO04362.1 RNA 3'-terminal phosphate cyclase [Serinibacter arcticus]